MSRAGLWAAKRGYTLVEIVVVVALITIVMGLVVTRYSWGGPRQQLIAQARRIGNLVIAYRDKAMEDQEPYLLRLLPQEGSFAVYRSIDHSAERAPVLSGKLPESIRFQVVKQQQRRVTGAAELLFNSHGAMPEWTIRMAHDAGPVLTLRFDPMVNEVRYEEP